MWVRVRARGSLVILCGDRLVLVLAPRDINWAVAKDPHSKAISDTAGVDKEELITLEHWTLVF